MPQNFLKAATMLTFLICIGQVVAQTDLPPAVQADILNNQIVAAIASHDRTDELKAFDDYHRLEMKGVLIPAPLLYEEAIAADANGDHIRAYTTLKKYLSSVTRADRHYKDAVRLYPMLASAEPVKENVAMLLAKERGHLKYPLFEKHAVNFCIDIDPSVQARFPDSSIDIQTRAALKLWILPIVSIFDSDVTIDRVTCDDAGLNLKIDIGPGTTTSSGASTQQTQEYNHHSISIVKINSSFNYESNGKQFDIFDFSMIAVKAGEDFKSTLRKVVDKANSDHMSVSNVADWRNIQDRVVQMSSYALLLYEIGHSIGLCDDHQDNSDCGPTPVYSYPSAEQDSLMKSHSFFYLTEKDQGDVQSLFRRMASGSSNVDHGTN